MHDPVSYASIYAILSDVYVTDDSLPFQLNICLASIVNLAGASILSLIALPFLAPVLLVLCAIYYGIQVGTASDAFPDNFHALLALLSVHDMRSETHYLSHTVTALQPPYGHRYGTDDHSSVSLC